MNYSILRQEEYAALQKVELHGLVLDVGGSKKSGYHNIVSGKNSFHVINLDENCEPDTFVDLEKKFPFDDEQFDHSLCLNVLEHIFNFENMFSEQVRCIKNKGYLVMATPFMHHIHGSPDDYLRYTQSSYRRLAEKNNCTIISITPLGFGFCSLMFQTIGGSLPTNILRQICKYFSINVDMFLNKISKKYRNLTEVIPLGYFVIMQKN